jgi:hypothetical protein
LLLRISFNILNELHLFLKIKMKYNNHRNDTNMEATGNSNVSKYRANLTT